MSISFSLHIICVVEKQLWFSQGFRFKLRVIDIGFSKHIQVLQIISTVQKWWRYTCILKVNINVAASLRLCATRPSVHSMLNALFKGCSRIKYLGEVGSTYFLTPTTLAPIKHLKIVMDTTHTIKISLPPVPHGYLILEQP